MSNNVRWRWVLLFSSLLIAFRITLLSAYSQQLLPKNKTHTLYAPLILNVNGAEPRGRTDAYQLIFVDGAGAWLYGPDSETATLLSTGLPLTTTVRAAPAGDRVALARADGWALFTAGGALIADQVAPGYQLDWDQNPDHLLISRLGEGITRLSLNSGARLPLLHTSDETNDHSPLWSVDRQSLIFAHQEFGEQLFIMQISSFDPAQLPYVGENRAAAKFNPRLTLLQETNSWHDQPMIFHWSTDGQTLIFAAKQRIHLINLTTQAKVTIEPPGFADNLANYGVDVNNDRILYGADGGIYVTGLAGGNGELVVVGTTLRMPRWSPDGSQIIYNDAAGRLHIFTLATGHVITLANATPIGNFDILATTSD